MSEVITMYKNSLTSHLLTKFDEVEITTKDFLNQPWIYIKAYHNEKAIVCDMSVMSYAMYGLSVDLLVKEWVNKWGEW